MTYDLQANGVNGTQAATVIEALPNFENTSLVVLFVNGSGGGAELGPGVGQSPPPPTPAGIQGSSSSAPGVIGTSEYGTGVSGTSGSVGVGGAGPVGVYGSGSSAQAGAGVVGQGTTRGTPGVVGMSLANSQGNVGSAAGVLGVSTGDSTTNPENQSGVAGAGVVGLSLVSVGVNIDVEGAPPTIPNPNDGPSGNGTGVWGASIGGTGVHGQSENSTGVVGQSGSGTGVTGSSESGPGGVLRSGSAAQLRLVPSSTPLADTSLMQTGQVGDLYMYSQEEEVGTTGTYNVSTTLWLCIAPPADGGQAVWAPVQLGDLVGG